MTTQTHQDRIDHEADLIPAFLTVRAFARRYEISRSKAYELLGGGHVRSVTIGRSRRIPRAAVLEFEASLDGGTL